MKIFAPTILIRLLLFHVKGAHDLIDGLNHFEINLGVLSQVVSPILTAVVLSRMSMCCP